jgi:hypothetical protein
MKLDSFSIQNLRGLTDPQTFSFCPLTLVVGANSSGKSTFIRSFPLLRQSVETITKGPILWFGRFVDFGVFKDVVSRNVSKSEIEFGFCVSLSKNLEEQPHMYYYPYLAILDDCKVEVTLVVAEDPGTGNTYTKQIRLVFDGRQVEINASADGSVHSFILDGQPLKSSAADLALRAGASIFSMAISRKAQSGTTVSIEADWLNSRQLGAFTDHLIEHVGELFHGSTNRGKKAQFTRWLGLGSTSSLCAQVKRLAAITPTSSERAKSQRADSAWMKKLQGIVLADRIPQLLNEIDSFLAATFKSVSYIGPLRATAERFYRQQDLAVDEVDPQGANLAMFLMGLSSSGQAEFSKWCQQSIGFSVEAKQNGAHVSINLRDSLDGGLFNVADMGFGYSQLLPVLATMWRALTAGPTQHLEAPAMRRRMVGPKLDQDSLSKIIAIEQPELHLHPRLQGRLARLLCAIVNESESSKTKVHLVCETHSETIVNEVGKLVSKGIIKPQQVQVLVFEKKDGESSSTVRKAEYDSDGVLLNWPYGFFLPSED